jgi:Leucine-rich repeat (LRR) protein
MSLTGAVSFAVLDENLLSGSLPNEELSSLSLLKRFSVSRKIKSGRKLSGPLPNFNQVPKLISLALDGNELSGTIPPDFLLASLSVGVVDLSGNSLTGTVPTNVKSLEGLQLILDGNKLSNVTLQPMKPEVDERKILTDFFQATGGSTWIRNDFWKTSVDYCDWYGVGCADGHVILLNLEANNVTGKLPQKVFDLPELQVLWLNSNPIELSFENARNAANLLELKMDGTKVRSLLGLGLCKSLTSLEMRSISLDGSFPQEVLELPNLRVLYMSNNSFTGPLPPSLAAVPYLRVLELDENAFSGTLSAFNDSVALTSVNLAFNKLSGSIPHDFLDRVPSFTSLSVYLQGNDLTGAIPEEFQRFENLNIDLHNNKIDAMPNVLCKKSSWNDGDVGTYGCDALLCPPGTTNVIGRSSFESQKCDRCRSAVPYFGQVDCVGHSAAFSGRHSTASGRALILFLMIAPGLGLLWPN